MPQSTKTPGSSVPPGRRFVNRSTGQLARGDGEEIPHGRGRLGVFHIRTPDGPQSSAV